MRELQTANGVPDLVLFTQDSGKSRFKTVAELPERFAFLAGKGVLPSSFGFADIKKITGLSESGSRDLLRRFERLNLIRKGATAGRWGIKHSMTPPIVQICAIEAKRKEWRKALYQASRYQDFAHQTWVLLDAASVSPALTALDTFKRLNVGLATINKMKEVAIYLSPKTESPRFFTRFWAVNVAIAKRQN